MSETTEGLIPQTGDNLPTDPVDDVEAHGIKEVAAAAGIGAVVMTGGGVALAASHSSATPVPRTPAVVQQATNDATRLAHDAAQGATGLANETLQDAQTMTGHALADVHGITDPAIAQVSDTLHSTTQFAKTTANDAASYATTTADNAVTYATSTANQELSTVKGTVSDLKSNVVDPTVNTATTKVNHTVDTAKQTVHATEKSALSVVSAVEDLVNKGWNLQLDVIGTGVSSGGSIMNPSGTVKITDASGHTLASAKVRNGKASVHLSALGQNETVTIHYSGDGVFGPTHLQWKLPVGF